MNFQIEHLEPANRESVLTRILDGYPTASPAVKPLKYGDVLSPTDLSALNIEDPNPAATINPFLSDINSQLNDPILGDYNCLLYDNKLGLVDDYNKDPLICSNNVQSKCTLSAFSDVDILGVTTNNKKSYNDYNTFIGKEGLKLEKQYVSCGDRVNKLMWIYKDASSENTNPDAIGIPVDQCGLVNLNTSDLSTTTSSINALCNIPESYSLVMDTVTNAGYKCKQIPGPGGISSITGGPGISTPLSSTISSATGIYSLKCNNL